MFTVEERLQVREGLLKKARSDNRVVAGAEVGSTAAGGGDRWSDLDLTFGVADDTNIAELLVDWTAELADQFSAVHLFDVTLQSSTYRVFLLPGHLQVDLSFTPRAEFGAIGPKFTLLFGKAIERDFVEAPGAAHVFGLGVHHAVRARICIERGRALQAEYWISGVRDQAMALACRLRGLESGNARGFDDLPADILDRFGGALVLSLERKELLRALKAAVDSLLSAAADFEDLPPGIEEQLRSLTEED
jgi:hypothetical protein